MITFQRYSFDLLQQKDTKQNQQREKMRGAKSKGLIQKEIQSQKESRCLA